MKRLLQSILVSPSSPIASSRIQVSCSTRAFYRKKLFNLFVRTYVPQECGEYGLEKTCDRFTATAMNLRASPLFPPPLFPGRTRRYQTTASPSVAKALAALVHVHPSKLRAELEREHQAQGGRGGRKTRSQTRHSKISTAKNVRGF